MADLFFYRADPPAELAGTSDLPALIKLQSGAGLNIVTPGRPVRPDEMKADPHGALARLSAELKTAKAAADMPVKLAMPLPGLLSLDPMLLGGLIGNLIAEGAKVIEFDGRAYADPATDASDDGFTLSGLLRPEGFRIAVRMGPLASWTAERLGAVAGDLAADRYLFEIADTDDLSRLTALPEESMAVLGVVDPAGGQSNEAILSLIDAAAEVVDQDRLALSSRGGFADGQEQAQARVLRQIADISVNFWGFAM